MGQKLFPVGTKGELIMTYWVDERGVVHFTNPRA